LKEGDRVFDAKRNRKGEVTLVDHASLSILWENNKRPMQYNLREADLSHIKKEKKVEPKTGESKTGESKKGEPKTVEPKASGAEVASPESIPLEEQEVAPITHGAFTALMSEKKDGVIHCVVKEGKDCIPFNKALQLLVEDEDFRSVIKDALEEGARHMPAYYWEHPGVSLATAASVWYEFVLVHAPKLEGIRADPHKFQEHFQDVPVSRQSTHFRNLKNDATLVVPVCPQKTPSDQYAHLAVFMAKEGATMQQALDLLKAVGEQMQEHMQEHRTPVWLGTCGESVNWLHVRLDDQPKYYNYVPYTQRPDEEP